MTPAELDAIEARVKAATPMESISATLPVAYRGTLVLSYWEQPTDAVVMAVELLLEHAPADLAALVAEVRRLQAEVDAALVEGHRRAVEETAIASVHKAVEAERAAVVAYLRSGGKAWEYAANDVEEGKHRE